MRMKVKMVLAMLAVVVGSIFVGVSPAQAAPSCYSVSCTGVNPEGTTCAEDAYTVLAMDVQGDGMLELRYSPSCKANWGRFSSYWLYDITNGLAGTGISHASVYVWNPDQELHGVAGSVVNVVGGSSWWTAMVDGAITACTGVELMAQTGDAQGWVGNLCV